MYDDFTDDEFLNRRTVNVICTKLADAPGLTDGYESECSSCNEPIWFSYDNISRSQKEIAERMKEFPEEYEGIKEEDIELVPFCSACAIKNGREAVSRQI